MTKSVDRHERLLSTVAEVRPVLCFKVPEAALRERLAPGWRAVPYADAAHAGADAAPFSD